MPTLEEQIQQIISTNQSEIVKADSYDRFTTAAKIMFQEAAAKSIYLTLALLDTGGHLCFLYRHPQAIFISLEMAQKKAHTAFALQLPSGELQHLTQPGAPLFQLESSGNGQLVTFAGGIPTDLMDLSAIGVSGAIDPADDLHFAKRFLDLIKE